MSKGQTSLGELQGMRTLDYSKFTDQTYWNKQRQEGATERGVTSKSNIIVTAPKINQLTQEKVLNPTPYERQSDKNERRQAQYIQQPAKSYTDITTRQRDLDQKRNDLIHYN